MKIPLRTFVFILKAKKQGRLNHDLLKAHVEHLRGLAKSGKLVICGPFQDGEQAMQIIRAESIESAVAAFQADPFVTEKYYQRFEVHELIEANEANNWLSSQ